MGAAAVAQAPPNGPGGTEYVGALRFAFVKSSDLAMLLAFASRGVSDGKFQRHSIILRIEVWSKISLETSLLRDHGAIIMAGTRKPRNANAAFTSSLRWRHVVKEAAVFV